MHLRTAPLRAPAESGYIRDVAKTKMGRPRRSAKVAEELVGVRVTKAERRAWDAAARRAEQSLSEWLRTIANREAGR